jgi:ATP-dependent Clp protease, protease subunit
MSKPRGVNVLEATECLFRFGFDPVARIVFLGEPTEQNPDLEVDRPMAQNFIKAMCMLDRTDGEITVVINTGGGSMIDGLAIYDMMRSCHNHVTAVVYGEACSMGCVILQGADKRVVSANSTIMFHEGSDSYAPDHARNVKYALDHGIALGERTNAIVNEAVHRKHPNKKLKEFWAFDKYFTAEQAVELGLADEVLPAR